MDSLLLDPSFLLINNLSLFKTTQDAAE